MGYPTVDAPYSQAAAPAAVQLVREGNGEALMKGSLHTDEPMSAVVRRESGLRKARRASHCFVMDVPGYENALIITDAPSTSHRRSMRKSTSCRARSIPGMH